MGVFEAISESLANIFGSSNFTIINAGETASDYEIGSIKSIEVRVDDSTITEIKDKAGVSVLAETRLDTATLSRGEFFTRGAKGFGDVTCGAGSLKINHA